MYFGLTDVSCSITEKRNLAVLLNFLFSNFIYKWDKIPSNFSKYSLAEVEKIKFTTIIQKLFVIKILANRDAIFFVSSNQNMLQPDFVDTFNGFFVHLKWIRCTPEVDSLYT